MIPCAATVAILLFPNDTSHLQCLYVNYFVPMKILAQKFFIIRELYYKLEETENTVQNKIICVITKNNKAKNIYV